MSTSTTSEIKSSKTEETTKKEEIQEEETSKKEETPKKNKAAAGQGSNHGAFTPTDDRKYLACKPCRENMKKVRKGLGEPGEERKDCSINKAEDTNGPCKRCQEKKIDCTFD